MHNFLTSPLVNFKGRVNYIVFILFGVIDATLLVDLLTPITQAFRSTSHLTIFLTPLQGSLSHTTSITSSLHHSTTKKRRVNYIVFILFGVIDASLLVDSLTC